MTNYNRKLEFDVQICETVASGRRFLRDAPRGNLRLQNKQSFARVRGTVGHGVSGCGSCPREGDQGERRTLMQVLQGVVPTPKHGPIPSP